MVDVAFVSRRLGFVATRHYSGAPRAAIQETVDGGNTWHDAWIGHGAETIAWLAVAGPRTVFAGGWGPRGRAALFVSRDAGESWVTLRPRPRVDRRRWVSSRAIFVTPKLGYLFTDPASFMAGAYLLTRDGGRTWRRLRLPKYTVGIQFVDGLHGYAAGSVEHGCTGAAWRTDDGGASWQRIFCGKVPLAAVQFLDARRGFVAGGWAQMTEQAPSGVVFATNDRGVTWQRRYANPRAGFHGGIQPIVDLRFLDARRGWARTGQCKCCPSGPCAGDVLVTRDGGRTWARRGDEVQLATIGARDAWTVPRCDVDCNVVWRTRNAGRSWRPLARPDLLEILSVQVSGGLVSLSTTGGRFVSTDGTRWRFARGDVLAARPGFSIELPSTWPRQALTARHGASAFAFKGRAVDVVNSAVVADSRRAYALPYIGFGLECKRESTRKLFVTDDGGRSWSRRRTPFNIASLAANGNRVVVVGVGANCTNLLASSDDSAHAWRM